MYRIWIVEDEPKIAGAIAAHLEKYGYEPHIARDFRNLKRELVDVRPHLVLLDIRLPYYDGFYWCRQFRTATNAPIIFISARSGEMDQVMALDNGGDDYLVKPFSLDVMLAKVKSQIRRAYGSFSPTAAPPDMLVVAGLSLDRNRFNVSFRDRFVRLSKTEFLLLEELARNAGKSIDRVALLERIWDDAASVDDNTLTVNIARIRRKLEQLGAPHTLETVRGFGYRLTIPADAEAGVP